MKSYLLRLTSLLACGSLLIACTDSGGADDVADDDADDDTGDDGDGDPARSYQVGGRVSGMWDDGVVSVRLQAPGFDVLVDVDANRDFEFLHAIPDGSRYWVTVNRNPPDHTCTVANGTGTVEGARVTDVEVVCAGPAVDVELAPALFDFDPETTEYAVDTSVLVNELDLRVTAPAATAIALDAHPVTSGTLSTIAIAPGDSVHTLRVTTAAASRTYTFMLSRGDGPLTQQVYGKASDAHANGQFGRSVAVSGDTIVVGASRAAYVFRETGTTWIQEAILTPSVTSDLSGFGARVAISGDTIAVSAPEDGSVAQFQGAVHVFTRTGTTWSEQAKLIGDVSTTGAMFGSGLALSGDRLAVGAEWLEEAYVYVRSGTTWTRQGRVVAPNGEFFDGFGGAVAISGDLLAVGARGEDSCAVGVGGSQIDNECTGAGAVYLFSWNGADWSFSEYVKSSHTAVYDGLGFTVALDGDLLAAGGARPSVDLYRRASGGWGVSQTVESMMYTSLTLAGDLLLAGGRLYRWSGSDWALEDAVTGSNTEQSDSFGESSSFDGTTLVVGARFEDSPAGGINPPETGNPDGTAQNVGAMYIFR